MAYTPAPSPGNILAGSSTLPPSEFCRRLGEFKCENLIGEGTFACVCARARRRAPCFGTHRQMQLGEACLGPEPFAAKDLRRHEISTS
jgi:hypothetical protein